MHSEIPAKSFEPTASWKTLCHRAKMLKQIRYFFDNREFIEVETPLLSAEVVIDRHLQPMAVNPTSLPLGQTVDHCPSWLQTSPEAAMKRLLASGTGAIYQITRSFRAGEIGHLHNPEFTIIEWYRPNDTMADGMSLLAELAQNILQTEPIEKVSYHDAFYKSTGINPHRATTLELIDKVKMLEIPIPDGLLESDRDGWLDLLLTHSVEPLLGNKQPVILYDYPASQAALAKIRQPIREEDSAVAERFELYYQGIELANGYHELLDVAELKERSVQANKQRIDDGNQPLPLPQRLLAAMQSGLPSCTGVALGFDRLVMLATGAKSISDVLTFPFDRA